MQESISYYDVRRKLVRLCSFVPAGRHNPDKQIGRTG
jgi:hypothetical protein